MATPLGKSDDLKVTLYLCAGCRLIAHLFYMPESLTAVEVAERFADGNTRVKELARAEWDAEKNSIRLETGVFVCSSGSAGTWQRWAWP